MGLWTPPRPPSLANGQFSDGAKEHLGTIEAGDGVSLRNAVVVLESEQLEETSEVLLLCEPRTGLRLPELASGNPASDCVWMRQRYQGTLPRSRVELPLSRCSCEP